MALDKDSVKKGIEILREINGGRTLKLEYYKEDDYPYFWKKEKKTNLTRIDWF